MTALAVGVYTLIEMTRRRLLLVLLVLAVVLIILIGIAPLVIPSFPKGAEARTVFFFGLTDSVIGIFALISALAIGATVVYHDLDSGAAVSIFAKPVSRFEYAAGKAGAAAASIVAIVAALEICSYVLLVLNGGQHQVLALGFYATTAANLVVIVLVVSVISTFVNNIVAAVLGFVFLQVIHFVEFMHNLVTLHLITDALWGAVISVGYWLVPHELQTDFGESGSRVISTIRGQTVAVSSLYSGWGDLVFWAAYCALLTGLLYLGIKRRQV